MLEALYIGLSGGLLAVMLSDFMEKGQILRCWKYWLTSITQRKRICPWLYNPLGGCVVCMSVWAVLGMWIIYHVYEPLWSLLFAISIGNFLITIMFHNELL